MPHCSSDCYPSDSILDPYCHRTIENLVHSLTNAVLRMFAAMIVIINMVYSHNISETMEKNSESSSISISGLESIHSSDTVLEISDTTISECLNRISPKCIICLREIENMEAISMCDTQCALNSNTSFVNATKYHRSCYKKYISRFPRLNVTESVGNETTSNHRGHITRYISQRNTTKNRRNEPIYDNSDYANDNSDVEHDKVDKMLRAMGVFALVLCLLLALIVILHLLY